MYWQINDNNNFLFLRDPIFRVKCFIMTVVIYIIGSIILNGVIIIRKKYVVYTFAKNMDIIYRKSRSTG